MAVLQLFIGLFYLVPLWASRLRPAPKLSADDVKGLVPVASMHAIGHLMTVISLGAGAVSFTHIIKAAEPFFSTVMSGIFLKSFFPIPVYLTLLPVVGGVGIASLTELSFSWLAFGTAMGSNTAFSMRAIFSKMAMEKPKVRARAPDAAAAAGWRAPCGAAPRRAPARGAPGALTPPRCAAADAWPFVSRCARARTRAHQGENMGAANLYAVLTIMSFIGLLPVALIAEPPSVLKAGWDASIAAGNSAKYLINTGLLSGLSYYLYNEVAFLCLDNVHPITHAVGNTIKRVVIILASVVVFGTPMTPLNKLGSSLAIFGVLLYSIAKNYFK